jgi:hypothetical protein
MTADAHRTIESHTSGNPTRTVLSGIPRPVLADVRGCTHVMFTGEPRDQLITAPDDLGAVA